MSRALIPNSTQIPDVILDHWMAELSGAEFKVLLYIARRTYGFGKDSDTISLTQIAQGVTRRDGTVLDRGTGISRPTIVKALKVLEERGIVIRRTNLSRSGLEFEENTYSINLDWEAHSGTPPVPAGEGPGSESGEEEPGLPVTGPGPAAEKSGGGVVKKVNHLVTQLNQGWCQNLTRVVKKVYPQETDLQETDQETATTGDPGRSPPGADAAVLTAELVSHGMGRSAAERLARSKPEACRRCLEYLPFAQVRTTKGAWLASAIRDEYGPPEGYLKARQAAEKRARADKAAARKKALLAAEAARRETRIDRLGTTYARLEQEHGEAFASFSRYLTEERARAEKVAANLSPARREEHLASFEGTERRLELFERWLNARPEGARLDADPPPIIVPSGFPEATSSPPLWPP